MKMANSSAQFPEEQLRKIFIELSNKRRLLRDLEQTYEDQSKKIMELQQKLEITQGNLTVAYQQIEILKDTSEKLQSYKIEMSLDQKVAYEAKEKETVTLRQQNLNLEIMKGQLRQELEAVKSKNRALTEKESTFTVQCEEISKKLESVKSQQEMIAKDFGKVTKNSESIQEKALGFKVTVDYYETVTANLRSDKKKLQEENQFLSNQNNELKGKTIKSEIGTDQNYQLIHAQTRIQRLEHELNCEIKKNTSLQLTLAQTIEAGKKMFSQKQELERQLK